MTHRRGAQRRTALTALAVLAAAKLLAWWIALASVGWSGAWQGLFRPRTSRRARFALVGMTATFGAATHATFTSIVFPFELTRYYQSILPLMLATVLAELVAATCSATASWPSSCPAAGSWRTATTRRACYPAHSRRGHDPSGPQAARHRDGRGGQAAFTQGPHSAYPLIDAEGDCVGMVSRGDLLDQLDEPDRPLLDVASRDLVTVAPDDLPRTALQRMITEEVEHLPVTDSNGALVGICTRTDVLRARGGQLADERTQPGRLSPMLRRSR